MPRSLPADTALAHRPRVRRGNEADAERMRADLVAAAMQIFTEQGLAAVSIRAVAQRVGVSPMAPYRYFADKAELLAGLWGSVIEALCTEMTRAVQAAQGARARHRAGVEAFLDFWEQHPDQFCLVYGFQELPQAPQAQAAAAGISAYAQLLALGRDLSTALAAELGADTRQVKLSTDIRVAMMLGYLHGTLVSNRYPWSDRATLRTAYVTQIEQAVERCLLGR